jgi:hypothetical protein
VLRVGLVATAAGVAAWASSSALGWSTPGAAILSALVGLVVAGAITVAGLWIARVHEFQEVMALLARRRARGVSTVDAAGGEDPAVER